MGFSGKAVTRGIAIAKRKAQGLQTGILETWEDDVTNGLCYYDTG
jgi:hypothetical protein